MARLTDPVEIGGLEIRNRLYRAPLLECAGTGPDTAETLVRELEPGAAAGVGLIHQGATVVRSEGGCVAPNMTRVADPEFVRSLSAVPEAVHDHDAKIVIQLEYGGIRSMETWHREYRREHPGLEQLAVSRPPAALRVADRLGLLEYDVHVMATEEVRELAADFGRSAQWAVEAGYDGVHLAGANMGIIQQFCSPYYNRRTDAFGGSLEDRLRFLELVHDEVRDRAGDVPLVTKVPAETAAPPFVRRHLTREDCVDACVHLAEYGFDAVVPVACSTFWDMSIIRGEYPERAWREAGFDAGYEAAFGSRRATRLVDWATRLESWFYDFEPAWNADLCRTVRERVDVPVLCEGGVRNREQMDRLLGADDASQPPACQPPACDLVGVGRPFYAEPRLPARLLGEDDATAVCENCNNCVVPQATGAPGMCRTPPVLRRRGELEREGAYEQPE